MIYFDYAASTPISEASKDAILQCLSSPYLNANPNSTGYINGIRSKQAIETARSDILDALGLSQTHYLIFTSGATESINIVNQGAYRSYKRSLQQLLCIRTDHKATIACIEGMRDTIQTNMIDVHPTGEINFESLSHHLSKGLSLLNVCGLNNETGVESPLNNVSQVAKKFGALVHIDASQMIGKMAINDLHCGDFISISSHKFYGPKGIGALAIKKTRKLSAIFFGSDQEYAIRPGTLPTHQILGMHAALVTTIKEFKNTSQKIANFSSQLRAFFESHGCVINGKDTNPYILSIRLPEAVDLDKLSHESADKIAFSYGSACQSKSILPSHVLTAMGQESSKARRTIRVSLGAQTSEDHLDYLYQFFLSFLST
tara:strand:+ start:4300 stop:5418 length:1119 start_codon:yes stop_codon:yes gene_type:complete